MFLKKFIYVNWGNIPATEFEFGPINLLSGGNGSGKTTSADAIQTIMTAAHDNLFNYNPGQDEATQRGRGKQVRTLASYVLGCDDGSFARPDGAVGYLAAVFHPTQGESAEPFTAIIGVSASIDRAGNTNVARQNDLQFYIVQGSELSLSDFVKEEDKEGKKSKSILPLDKLYKSMQKNLGSNLVERYDTKKQYLRRLYAALKGRNDAISEREALNAARAFSRFMAYKPVKSINGFVANEILEKKDLGDAIRTVSDLMKTIHAMESDASELKQTIDSLVQTSSQTDSYISNWIEHKVVEYTAAKSRYVKDQQGYLKAKDQERKLKEDLGANQKEQEIAEERRKQIRERLLSLEAQRLGINALQEKDKYEKQIEASRQRLGTIAPPLLEQDKALTASIEASKNILNSLTKTSISMEISSLAQKPLLKACREVSGLEPEQLDFPRLLGKDWIDISPLEQHLDQAVNTQKTLNQWRESWYNSELEKSEVSLRDQVAKVLDRRAQKLEQIRRQANQKQQEVDNLDSAQANLPHYTRAAIEMIKRECPEADPRVLCDYVEISDSQWQSAIEGYIGGARFSIVVEQEYEAEAIRIVRNMPGRDNRARVIQGSKAKADADRFKLHARSIINLMNFEHATAKHYLSASYGNVEQVPDRDALRNTRRGVTKDGMGSGAYSMYRCDLPDSELVFGKGARERAKAAKLKELEVLNQQANEAQQQLFEAKQLLDSVSLLRHLTYADHIQQILEVHREIESAEQAMDQLDLSDFSQIEVEFNELKVKADELDGEIAALLKREGQLKQSIDNKSKECEKLSLAQEETEIASEQHEENLNKITSIWPDFDAESRLIEADKEAETITQDFVDNQVQALASELNAKAHEIDRNVTEHNGRCAPADALVYTANYSEGHSAAFFKAVCQLQRELDRVHNRLKNNILVEKQDKLEQLKDSFNNVFVTNLCHSIYHSINEGKRILEDMNKELEHHRFGADREGYWFDWEWVPEYKEYWKFFDEVIKSPSLGEGQTLFDAELTGQSQKIRDQLMGMLLDEDEQKAMRELERISDYRNYRNYEIFKQPEGKDPIALSQYGTGSGGQLETPAYIIRSAAITSAFRFNEGDSHLRMVLVDEAFSKMDETRSKEVIAYLTQTLGLQILFIMPTSKSGPFMDLISNQFVFTKVPLPKGQKIGEMNTRVLVDRQSCNQEKIKELWAHHRKTIRKQAELDFLEGL